MMRSRLQHRERERGGGRRREGENERSRKVDKPEDSRTRQKKRITSYLIVVDFRKKMERQEKKTDSGRT